MRRKRTFADTLTPPPGSRPLPYLRWRWLLASDKLIIDAIGRDGVLTAP